MINAPLDEIARRASVGNATLYRHFHDRRELIQAVVLDVVTSITTEAKLALSDEPDPFAALRRFVHRAADHRIGVVIPALAHHMIIDEIFYETGTHLMTTVKKMIDEAVTAGLVRPDIGLGDLMIPLTLLTRPPPDSTCVDLDHLVHRHLDLLLDGLRTPQRSELSGTPMTFADLLQGRATPLTTE